MAGLSRHAYPQIRGIIAKMGRLEDHCRDDTCIQICLRSGPKVLSRPLESFVWLASDSVVFVSLR